MKTADCVLSSYLMLKKVLETTLEGTECAKLCFQSNMNPPLTFIAMDALLVSQGHTEFRAACFERCNITQNHEVSIDVKEFHDFVRNCKGSKRIQLICKDGAVKVHEMGGIHERLLKTRRSDTTPYIGLETLGYADWPSFKLSATEFSTIMLDMAVGGTEVEITMHTNADVHLSTVFEAGTIETFLPAEAMLEHVAPHHNALQTRRFIVKFLKLLCSIALIVTVVRIFVSSDRLVVEMHDASDQFNHRFTIRPYDGPRGVKVPQVYLNYVLREN